MRRAVAAGSALTAGFLLALTGCAAAEPAPSGTPEPAETGTSVFALGAGDCFDAELASLLEHVELAECAGPHDFEIFASLLEPEGEFSGAEVHQHAIDRCTEAFEAFVGIRYRDSALEINFLEPNAEDWAAGNRSILCFLSDPAGPLTGTAAQTAR